MYFIKLWIINVNNSIKIPFDFEMVKLIELISVDKIIKSFELKFIFKVFSINVKKFMFSMKKFFSFEIMKFLIENSKYSIDDFENDKIN